jgi:cytochrome c
MSGQLIDCRDALRWENVPPAGRIRHIACFIMIAFGAVAAGAATHARTANDAQALAERGLAHIRDVGREQAFADFNRPDGGFVDGELYVFCEDVSGVIMAHGGNPKIVGINIKDMLGPERALLDGQGKHFGLTRSSGWIDSSWPNPVTKRIELKSVYLLRVDDRTICGSGYYTGAPP